MTMSDIDSYTADRFHATIPCSRLHPPSPSSNYGCGIQPHLPPLLRWAKIIHTTVKSLSPLTSASMYQQPNYVSFVQQTYGMPCSTHLTVIMQQQLKQAMTSKLHINNCVSQWGKNKIIFTAPPHCKRPIHACTKEFCQGIFGKTWSIEAIRSREKGTLNSTVISCSLSVGKLFTYQTDE